MRLFIDRTESARKTNPAAGGVSAECYAVRGFLRLPFLRSGLGNTCCADPVGQRPVNLIHAVFRHILAY